MKTFSEYLEDKQNLIEEGLIFKSDEEKALKAAQKAADKAMNKADIDWKLAHTPSPEQAYNNATNMHRALEALGHGLGASAIAAASLWVVYVLLKLGKNYGTKLSQKFHWNFGNAKKYKENLTTEGNKPGVKNIGQKLDNLEKSNESWQELFDPISRKDWEQAKLEWDALSERNKEGLTQLVIEKIIEACGEPPIYVASPGNETYKAIKKILGQKTAIYSAQVFSGKIKELGE